MNGISGQPLGYQHCCWCNKLCVLICRWNLQIYKLDQDRSYLVKRKKDQAKGLNPAIYSIIIFSTTLIGHSTVGAELPCLTRSIPRSLNPLRIQPLINQNHSQKTLVVHWLWLLWLNRVKKKHKRLEHANHKKHTSDVLAQSKKKAGDAYSWSYRLYSKSYMLRYAWRPIQLVPP